MLSGQSTGRSKPGVLALILVTAVFSLSLLRLSTANVSYFQLRQHVLKHAMKVNNLLFDVG